VRNLHTETAQFDNRFSIRGQRLQPENATDLSAALTMPVPGEGRSVGEILLAEGLIDQARLAQLQPCSAAEGDPLRSLCESGFVNEDALGRARAASLGLPFVDPTEFEIQQPAVDAVPAALARQYRLMPLCFLRGALVIAVADPSAEDLVNALALTLANPVQLVVAAPDRIERAIAHWYGSHDDEDALQEIQRLHGFDVSAHCPVLDLAALGRQKPVVRLVRNMLSDAIQQRASDVHVRPLEKTAELLYRIDGTLVRMRSFPKSVLPAVVSRVKILGNMDIAEHRLPQDGHMRMTGYGKVVDMRLSIIPTVQGESVVIRLLDPGAGLKSLDQIGFSEVDRSHFGELMTRTAGLVLVTGPTGCGKSTTLYAALQEIRRHDVNLVTVEDPVEYRLAGVNQIEVNAATGLTFPIALRHILRHDPDVIMIGEIRDFETAKIAVESSLTGHLVLSTLHTNNAASAVTRLLEIGIEPYLVNTSLMAVLAQRLVRRNCGACVEPEAVAQGVREVLGVDADEAFLRGRGCSQCHGTGYSGRRAVYELLMVTPGLRERIAAEASSAAIEAHAVGEGMQPLTRNALELARAGETSLAEVYRIRLS